MTLQDYIAKLRSEIKSSEATTQQQEQRLGLALHILANIERTRRSESSSLNKDFWEMAAAGDPVFLKLYKFSPGYITKPLIHKMVHRTMTKQEYEMILNGTHPDLVKAKQPWYASFFPSVQEYFR